MWFKVTLRSAWYHKRLLAVTLIASWLITGFCALIPLFLDTLSEAASRRIVDDIRAETATLTLSNPRPFAPETVPIIDRELGGLITDKIAFSRAFGGPGYPNLGKICGYDYVRGELLTARARYAARTSDHCYKIYSFAALPELFRLADGRWPEELNPDLPPPPMTMDAAQIEAVITPDIARTAGFEIGDHLVVGDNTDQALIVEIVGLVEPLLPPDDVFWHGHAVVQSGEWTPMGDDMRFDVGLIVPGEAFERWILPRNEPNVVYHWWLRADSTLITGETLKTLDASLYRLERDLRADHPQFELVSGLKTITEQFKADLDRFERPVWVLAGAVLLLMVYQVWVMTRLVLDGARREQTLITSRGASVSQRVMLRAAVIGLAVITSMIVGPLLARAALSLFQQVGPLAALSENHTPDWSDSLAETYAGAGGLLVLLLLAVWYTARFPIHHSRAEEPAKPLWRRYGLDLLLIAAGLTFVLRLYFSATGDLGQSITALWQSPAALMDQIGAGEQARADGLGDPFNLAGPVLILVGLTLLWLRLYPLLVRLAAPLLRRGLVIPLAVWQTGRNAGHHTPLVVMLTATLVLGAGSLALDSTVNTRAKMLAQEEIGADVRLEYAQVEPGWETLPGVSESAVVMRLAASEQITLLGIDPGSTFPGLKEAADLLAGQPSKLPGWILPDESAAVQIQIETPAEDEKVTTTQLDLQLLDGRGVPFTFPLSPAEPGVASQFVIYRAILPAADILPWRLIGFRLRSVRTGISSFSHTIYLDDLAVLDAQGVVTVLEDFEQTDAANVWASAVSQPDTALITARTTEHAASGTASLQVDYRIRYATVRELQPLLMVHEVAIPQVPLIVSEAFADWQQRRSGTGQHLAVGDEGRVQFELAVGRFWLAYRVVAIFPAADPAERLVIAPFDDLRIALNAQSRPGGYYDANQVWLALESAEPRAVFRQRVTDLAGVESSVYAWDRYNDLRREPALKAVTGILFAAFWFAWGLVTLTQLVITASGRDPTGRTLNILGLDRHHLRRLWAAEQIILLVPTLIFGALASLLLVYLLLPFLSLIESDTLYLSRASLGAMLLLALTLIVPVMVTVAVQQHEQDGQL